MKLTMSARRRILLFAASFFVTMTCGAAHAIAEQRFPVEDLCDACENAKADFRPITEADLKNAKIDLVNAIDRLDKRLQAGGRIGADWRDYLLWQRMQQQLQRDAEPDLDALHEVYKRYHAEHQGLKLIWFTDVHDALRRYRLIARAVDSPKAREGFEQIITGLPTFIEAYEAEPTTELAMAIGDAIRWLEDRGQVPELLAKLRQDLGYPNLSLQVSGELLRAVIAGPVDDVTPVRDFILGTDIRGTGHTTGQIRADLVPDQHRGVFETTLSGTANTKSIGYNSPVRIYSTSSTDITGRKRFSVGPEGLASEPAVSKAKTQTRIHDIRSRHGFRLVQRAAWRRAEKQQGTAEWIAARHAQQRLNRRMDREADDLIERVNGAYRKKFRLPLVWRNLFAERLDFRTAEDTLNIAWQQADRGQLGAPGKPPKLTDDCDLAVQIHQSMVNNMAATALAGGAFGEPSILAALKRLDASQELLDRARSMEGEPPWKIAFAPTRSRTGEITLPISVHFANGGFVVTIRGDAYYRGSTSYPAANIAATYVFEQTKRGFKAIRQGDLDVTRPDGGFPTGRAVFLRRFQRLFPEEIVIEQLELQIGKKRGVGPDRKGALSAKTVRMNSVQCVCQHGWLTITWKLTSSD